jgi:thioredoxin-related protein
MKKILFPIFIFLSGFISAQDGIQFFGGSWDEAIETAKKEHKLIFMDAYAEWCGPCKRMAKEVFTQKELGDFFNKYFINVKMDMEKGEGPKLAQKFKVSAYPTLFFIDAAGDVVNVQVGGVNGEQLLGLAKISMNKGDKSKNFEEEYEKGNRDPEMLKAYAYALKVSGKPAMKIANEYIKTQGDISSEAFLEFIFDFATEADCSIFDKLVQHREELIKMKGEEVFRNKAEKACHATVEKAVDFMTPKLLDEAKKQMKLALPSFSNEYNLLADIKYHIRAKDLNKAAGLLEKYVSKFGKGNEKKLYYAAQLVAEQNFNKKLNLKAEKWAAEAYSKKKSKEHAKTYAILLKKNAKDAELKKLEEEIKTLN